jgi:hypothetical protein
MRRVQVLFAKEPGAADREKWKNQSGFSILSNGVNPDRPAARPYRPFGRIFHAGMKYPG